MRLLPLSTLAVALTSSFTNAIGSSLTSRSLDTCAVLNTELVVPDLLGILTAVGVINTCLCISQLPLFLQTNVVGILAVTIAGEQVVTDILTSLINQSPCPGAPTHGSPICASGTCSFTCQDGYTPFPATNPTKCVCHHPKKECDGICQKHCPRLSQVPESPERRALRYGGPQCPHGLIPCGIPGRSTRTWECLNVQTDLESCGGCALPLNAHSPFGRDCTSLPGVSDVSCLHGQCLVHRCKPGYRLNKSGSFCRRDAKVGAGVWAQDDEEDYQRWTQ